MGELAALATAVFWTFTSIFFSTASNRLGSVVVNRIRLAFAVLYLLLTHLILQGQLLPLQAGAQRWMWLGLSGIVGLVIGDACLLQTYVFVGTRLGTLFMALAPVISTLLAWVFLGETLSALEVAGILVTVAGVVVVVLDRSSTKDQHDRKRFALGVLTGLGAAAGQAVGLILAKKGLEGGFPSISGVMIRMTVASLTIWLLAVLSRQTTQTIRIALSDRKMLAYIALGATFGPFLGVWLSLVSVQATYVGIASTLMALTPILVLPILKWWFKEYISPRAVVGTVIALAGVAMLFM